VGFTPEGFVQLMCAVPFRRHHEADNHIFKVAAQITFEISNQVLERKKESRSLNSICASEKA
jgi:adenosylcobinamide amidohydrolase